MKKWFIPLIALALSLLSLATLSSVSPDLMRRQLFFWLASFSLFWFVSQIPLRAWLKWGDWAWKGLVIILVGLLIFGRATRGATAWIDLGWGLRFQPSQFAVLMTTFAVLARFTQQRMLRERELIELLVLLGTPALLILFQPDFGTVFLYTLAVAPLLIWQKIPRVYWRWFFIGIVALMAVGWAVVLEPYQQERITSFMAGSKADQSNTGYNARQALIAVGAGQLFGRGLGHGTQSQLRFLPERQTVVICASLAEEWGLVGSVAVILLYTLLIGFLLNQAGKTDQISHTLFLLIAAVYFLSQVFVNIGMNVGLLPITGITLPLVSYGGSSLLATMILLAVAQQLVMHTREHFGKRIS